MQNNKFLTDMVKMLTMSVKNLAVVVIGGYLYVLHRYAIRFTVR